MVRPLLRTRQATPSRGGKFVYGSGQSRRLLRSKNVPVCGSRKYVLGVATGEGLSSQRNPGVIRIRDETCQVSCAQSESSVTSVAALTAGELPSQRYFLSVREVMLSAMALRTLVASRRMGTMRR